MAKKKTKKAAPKAASKDTCACNHTHCGCMWFSVAVSEAAFYAALYYGLYVLGVSCAGLWWKSLILFGLINISVLFCPMMNPHLAKKFGHGQ